MNEEEQILAVLKEGFEKELFEAALYNLRDTNNKLRYNNFAYAMRELLRNFLHRHAPDDCVKNCEWYLRDSSEPEVTRRQRVKYFLQGGLSDEYVLNQLEINDAKDIEKLIKQINNLSKYTHINPGIFNINEDTVKKLRDKILGVVNIIFNNFEKYREKLKEKLSHNVYEFNLEFLKETIINRIDQLATHYSVEDIDMDLKVTNINDSDIEFSVKGTIDVILQYGSNSDVRNDLGGVDSDSFPFEISLSSSTGSPDDLDVIEGSFRVDTSSFYK